ncbi:hypothetical protein PR003_g29093 [Phytophthora rubi]|uniref:Uncharacterized protein n=1 Tax=Phytophthora rubi TaxID=129364 RepID=A0A6A4BMJ1_9STRA|nr:hypothetical protein PR003_g29093 [Phytophthora rubi]
MSPTSGSIFGRFGTAYDSSYNCMVLSSMLAAIGAAPMLSKPLQ